MFENLVDIVSQSGYLGIFMLMFIENVFPPIPSELIMPMAGFAASRGDLNLVLVIISGTLGSIVGALPWYYAGALIGKERLKRLADRYGRWLTVSSIDIDNATLWFQRYGRRAVFFGRLIPAIRTLISIPAGITRMPLWPFLLYSTIGSMLWTGLLAVSGFLLEKQYAVVAEYVDPVSKIVVILVVAIYFYRLVRHSQQKVQ